MFRKFCHIYWMQQKFLKFQGKSLKQLAMCWKKKEKRQENQWRFLVYKKFLMKAFVGMNLLTWLPKGEPQSFSLHFLNNSTYSEWKKQSNCAIVLLWALVTSLILTQVNGRKVFNNKTFINDMSHVMWKPMPYANNKGADPSAHLCSLISTFVVCCPGSLIPL